MDQLQTYIERTHAVFLSLADDVNLDSKSFQLALATIAFNPIFWNIAARLEYKTHVITKLAGSPKKGCYLLAATIFSLGLFRDYVYENALKEQPVSKLLISNEYIKYIGVFLFSVGSTLVLSSMYALGVTGTYLGDYFGILMTERVTGFPFNVTENPMYEGSTMCFLGTALWYGKPAGIFASIFVSVMYKIALFFEEPFTAKIYAEKDKKKN